MNKASFPFIIYFLLYLFTTGCERDDICLVETESTPRLIIHFFDKQERDTRKAVDNISVYGVGREEKLITLSTDSLALPLNVQKSVTQYAFLLSTSTASLTIGDTIQFNYQRFDKYINRACGYRANFILNENTITYPSSTTIWIDSFSILKDTVSDEKQVHMAIYH